MVPEGWTLSTIGEHVDLLSGFPFKSSNYTNDENDVRLLRGDNIGQGYLRWRDAKRWSISKVEGLQEYYLQPGDFVIAMDRTWIPAGVKISEVKEEDIPCLLVQRVSRLRAKSSLDQRLLRQLFSSHRFEQYVKKVQTETAVPHISPTDIREFPILVPPVTEQNKIADILSTWDRAIETVEKLVENSEWQKKALMQLLLDDPSWPCVQLGDLGDISSAGVDKKTNTDEKPVRLLNYLDVLNRDFIFDDDLTHWVTAPDRQIEKCDVRRGDIFFTPSSETRDDISHSGVAVEDIHSAAYSYHVVRFRLNEPWDLNYRTYAFKTPHFYRQAYQLCEGSGQRYVLSQRYFRQMAIRIPPIKEQKVIGSTLRTIDEISARYKSLAQALRQEKRALMQQLLTGKRRVRVDDAAESAYA